MTVVGRFARLAGRMWKQTAWLGVLGLAAGVSVGCAEEREPINNVQPNALSKAFFVGDDLQDNADDPEFYARAVVTDVGYGAAQDGLFTSSYAQPISRIKWEITEDLLIGRLAYQRIDNSDNHGTGPADVDGQVAYAFPIISHFDIKRDYNPTTGETSNRTVENTTDNPWYQRKFMRVDWSRNLNTDAYDFDTLSQIGVYGGISYEPLSYWETDPNAPDAPHFATDEGYFDVTNKAYATPGVIDLSSLGWGINSFPACYLPNDIFGGSAPFGNCNPVELTMRFSFKRVVKSDYEPVDWLEQFTSYGIFYQERLGYDKGFGITDSKWHRFASRYNIWDWSHHYEDAKGDKCGAGMTLSNDFAGKCEMRCYTDATPVGEDPNRDADANGTADECEGAGAGSQCDVYEHKCTEPYAKRKAKPIVWHYTKDSNTKYFEGTDKATHEWDVAMRTAVQTARYAECVRVTPGDPSAVEQACLTAYPMYTGQQEDNEDAVSLAGEVDDCRAGRGGWATENGGSAPWSDGRMDFCKGQADTIGAARGSAPGVIAIAKMDEMVTLCHGPVEAQDSPECIKDIQKAMSDKGKAADKRQVLPAGITSVDCEAQWETRYTDPDAVDETKLAACDNGFYARIGDLRYHQINVIKNPQTPSPWGIMVDADDPLTGEKVQASVNVWSHVNDLAGQGLVDTLRYIAGELTTEEITDGKYVKDWADAVEASGGKGALGTMDKATVQRRQLSVFDGRSFSRSAPKFDVENPPVLPENLKLQAKEFLGKNLSKIRSDANAISVNRPYTDARRNAALDTATEASLVTPEMMELSGMNRSELNAAETEVSAGAVGQTAASGSILRALNPQIRRDIKTARELGLANRGACILSADEIMAPTPNTLANLGKVIERKFGPFDPTADKTTQYAHANLIRDFIAQRYQYGVIIHEMGHSIGERHNFVSSYFAWGYRPQYWQLRTQDGAVKNECTDVSADGKDCVGPRYFDPPTDEEQENLLPMWQQSSVMDYPGEVAQDMLGLGAYDFAAARMFYGQSVAVFADSSYNAGKARSKTILNLTDTFGGIIGYQYVDGSGAPLHYTQLQDKLEQIHDCAEVDANAWKPKSWDESKYGVWDPLLDGFIVTVKGKTTRCKSQPVDYVQYSSLRVAQGSEANGAGYYDDHRRVFDQQKRTKVPYGFATDSWADLGNLSVYRHDNGADPYELFNFFITEQETRHIFDNYRRNRTAFSVKAQSSRILERYNEKMRDGAKGLALFANIYRDVMIQSGVDFDAGTGAVLFNYFFPENMLASGLAFDHFTKQFQRPESGQHQLGCQVGNLFSGGCDKVESDRIIRATADNNGGDTGQYMNVFDGASGYFGQVAFGGKLMENQLSDDKGEFDRDYTMNAGSYYDKVYAPYLLSESEDNFISDSLGDFTDSRYRAVSMADLFPDGYRRFLANNLTGDDWIKGPRVAASGGANSLPTIDGDGYPTQGIGFTTWWTSTPTTCFPGSEQIVCAQYGCPDGTVCVGNGQLTGVTDVVPLDNPDAPASVLAIDPQVNFDQWKFLIAQTLLYIPENQKTDWIDLMGMWELGGDTDPGFDNRIELHLPDGRVYIARTYGTETIFGKSVQRGVAARVLEYANSLLEQSYEGTMFTSPQGVSWYLPTIVNGAPVVKWDPNVSKTAPTCSSTDNSGCTCSSNQSCVKLQNYKSLPAFIRQSLHDFRMADASMKGIYE